jgi:hypoxanthine phosphoribosyltransferase
MIEQIEHLDAMILVGIRRRGVPLAQRLADLIDTYAGVRVRVGEADITLYRDDLSSISDQPRVRGTAISGELKGTSVVLVDDVLYTGRTARAAMEAVLAAREAGKKVGLFRPITVWPFPEKQLRSRLPQLKHILMVEHNHGQMLLEVQRTAGGRVPVSFLGKVDGTVISPAEILAKLQEMEV